MALAPVGKLKKSEIIWLNNHRCKHSHSYLEHYSCYLKENPKGLKIGFFDIETSNLDANYGICFCYCIKEMGKNKIYHRTITKKELEEDLDKKVIEQCIKDLKKFDRIIGYYSSRFDFPFVRTRAVYWGLDFPLYGELWHDDIYYIIRGKFKLNRNRLETACQTLLGKSRKTHIEATHWIKALQGNRKSLAYILDHCKGDVRDLEDLYNKVIDFKANSDRSI